MDRHASRRGQLAIAAAAVGYGVDTALSVAALHGLRPADLLTIELGGSAAILLAVAGATGKLRRQGAGRALAQGAVLPGLSFLLGNLGLARTTATSGALLLSVDTVQPDGEGAGDSAGRTAWQFLGAVLAVLPFIIGSWWTGGSRIATADPGTLLAAAAVLICGLGALLAFNLGIDAISASRAGLIFTLQPLAGATTAIAVFGEPLVAGQAAGGALILTGLLLLTRERPANRRPDKPANVTAATTTTRGKRV